MLKMAPGFLLIAILVGLGAGCLLGAQPSVNGQLGRAVAHPLQATLISFGSGTLIIILISLINGTLIPVFKTSPSALPWWIWFGGSIGVVLVTTSLIFVPRIGSLPWFAALMTGQTVCAILLDHFGWLGNPQSQVSPMRLLGAAFLVAGVLIIVQAKRTEQASHAGHQPNALPPVSESQDP